MDIVVISKDAQMLDYLFSVVLILSFLFLAICSYSHPSNFLVSVLSILWDWAPDADWVKFLAGVICFEQHDGTNLVYTEYCELINNITYTHCRELMNCLKSADRLPLPCMKKVMVWYVLARAARLWWDRMRCPILSWTTAAVSGDIFMRLSCFSSPLLKLSDERNRTTRSDILTHGRYWN